MTTTICASCSAGPIGEAGHGAMRFYVGGPFPGHHIFKCNACSERWIRHYGDIGAKFAWTRYSDRFAVRMPRPVAIGAKASL